MTHRTLLVTGLPRSGSSLTMRMLSAGGVPVVGTAPDFEDERSLPGNFTAEWMDTLHGRALKFLDPQWRPRTMFQRDRFAVVLLTRDPVQQAASQAKLMHWAAGVPWPTRNQRRALIAEVRKDAAKALAMLKASGCPLLVQPFEHLVVRPGAAAGVLARFLSPWWDDVDPFEMARVVIRRNPDCLPGMLEHHQLVDLAMKGAL